MAVRWYRLADLAQRGMAVVLFSLTLYGTVVLAQGGWGVVQRRKARKAVEGGGGGGKVWSTAEGGSGYHYDVIVFLLQTVNDANAKTEPQSAEQK